MRSLTESRHRDRCIECGGFLPHAWEWEEVDEEDEYRRYRRIVWFVECSKCGTMNKEDD